MQASSRTPGLALLAPLLGALVVLAHAVPAAALPPGFHDLGVVAGGDAFLSDARGVSGDGRVVVGESTIVLDIPECCFSTDVRAFRWEEGVFTLLPPHPDHERSIATAASYDGSVITGLVDTYTLSPSWRGGFVWQGGGLTPLGDLPGGSAWSVGTAVSDDGTVIAAQGNDAVTDRAIRWDAGVLTNLGTGTGSSQANGVSGDGSVVVGSQRENGVSVAKRWDGVGMSDLPLPPGALGAMAFGISPDGSVIVGRASFSAGAQAVRWGAVGAQALGMLHPQDSESRALDASGDGSVIVGWSKDRFAPLGTQASYAFLWTAADGMRSLQDVLANDYGFDVTGWQLTTANGISDDGNVIVGTGVSPENLERGWIAVLPEPAACSNGSDDDGDGAADAPADPGCLGADDDSEHAGELICDDGLDNDGDGKLDWKGVDLDGDGEHDGAGEAVADPHCMGIATKHELGPGCGLGGEVALLLLPLLRRRRPAGALAIAL